MTSPAVQDLLTRLRASKGDRTETKPEPLPSDQTSTATQAPVANEAPATLAPVAKRTRRKWTADDYRIRGLKAPDEREPRAKLNAEVSPATLAKVRAYAIENGVSIGRAVDQLIEFGDQ